MADLVLIDTCIWAPFFARKKSPHKSAVADLLDQDRAAIIGPILAEVLLGFTKDTEADWVASALAGVQYLELSRKAWRAAAKLGRHLAAGGHFLPVSDLALAVAALRHQYSLYSIDPHFDVVPNLKRFVPEDITKKSRKK
jgi:predicted nucleic acid-binding protein